MSLQEFLRRRGKRIAMVINGLFCLVMTYGAVTYFNSPPHPSAHARLGSVAINLGQLAYRLTYEDLQSAGMFSGQGCRKCDFSRGASGSRHEDFENPQFMGTLYKARNVLWLHFYGEDVPAGQQRLEQSLQTLRARFPGRSDAIRQVAGGFGDNPEIRLDW